MITETEEEIKTDDPEEKKTENTGGEEIPEKPKEEKKEEQKKPEDKLEDDFNDFVNTKTEHKVNTETKTEKKQESKDLFSDDNDIDEVDEFKFRMFMSLFFTLLNGIHTIIYRIISKYQLNKEDIALDDDDKEDLEMYFRTQRVMDLINRLPSEIIGIIHIEYIYFEKFSEFTKKQEALNSGEEEEEEEEEEDTTKKTPIKKKPKKRRKKKPVKKEAVLK